MFAYVQSAVNHSIIQIFSSAFSSRPQRRTSRSTTGRLRFTKACSVEPWPATPRPAAPRKKVNPLHQGLYPGCYCQKIVIRPAAYSSRPSGPVKQFVFSNSAWHSEIPHQLGTPDFKPYQVVGIVDHPHLVGFFVAYPDPGFSLDHRCTIFP